MLCLILDICDKGFDFEDYEKCRDYFKKMINIIKQMNYSEYKSESFESYLNQLNKLLEENGK
jgi:V/A-type H+-transporting ATPase subunit A